MPQWARFSLYFSIAFLTAIVTDPLVLMAQNEPVMMEAMHPFQWSIIFLRALLAGLITLKAVAGRSDPESVDPTKIELPKPPKP